MFDFTASQVALLIYANQLGIRTAEDRITELEVEVDEYRQQRVCGQVLELEHVLATQSKPALCSLKSLSGR